LNDVYLLIVVRSTTTFNYNVAHNMQTEFKEQNLIKECHATPNKIHKITAEI